MIDAKGAACAAHLRYGSDHNPGITRVRNGAACDFIDTDGSVITEPDVIARIKKLAIPPAYTDVWICCDRPQAVGRRQHQCHAKQRKIRDEAKCQVLPDQNLLSSPIVMACSITCSATT